MVEKKKKMTKADMEEYVNSRSDDYEPDGPLGHDPEFMAVKKVNIKSRPSDLRSIRIDEEFLEAIKAAADDEGFDSYQTFIKVVLKRYIKDKKKKEA